MKILQINSVCGFGSTGRIVTDLYEILKMHGHECLIAYGRGEAPPTINTLKISSGIDNKMHGLLTRITDKHGFGSVKATQLFIKEIENYSPDLIQLHNLHGYYINIEILFDYLSRAGKPVVWTLHDCWSFTGHCSHFDFVGCERWRNGCYHCLQKNMYPSSKLIDNSKWNYQKKKSLFTSVDNMTIVTPSKWLASLVKDSFLNKYNINVISNGIDLETFHSPRETTNEIQVIKEQLGCKDQFIILAVASIWTERKGLEYLIEISKLLDESHRVVIVGLTEKQKRNLPFNVIGITRTNNTEQLAQIYSLADVYLNTTLEEVQGMTNLEALACGTPVITFDTGGSPECIDRTCGIVIEKGSIEGIIKAIKKIKEDLISREACIKRAKEFNKNNKFSEYMSLFHNILEESNK